jgi:hypothetical protein
MVDTKTQTKYKCILASFMLFNHNCAAGSEYPRDHVHAIEVLAAVTPNDVLSYLNMKTFGTTEPVGDANPILARANRWQWTKKQIRISCQIATCGVYLELKETLPVVRW